MLVPEIRNLSFLLNTFQPIKEVLYRTCLILSSTLNIHERMLTYCRYLNQFVFFNVSLLSQRFESEDSKIIAKLLIIRRLDRSKTLHKMN